MPRLPRKPTPLLDRQRFTSLGTPLLADGTHHRAYWDRRGGGVSNEDAMRSISSMRASDAAWARRCSSRIAEMREDADVGGVGNEARWRGDAEAWRSGDERRRPEDDGAGRLSLRDGACVGDRAAAQAAAVAAASPGLAASRAAAAAIPATSPSRGPPRFPPRLPPRPPPRKRDGGGGGAKTERGGLVGATGGIRAGISPREGALPSTPEAATDEKCGMLGLAARRTSVAANDVEGAAERGTTTTERERRTGDAAGDGVGASGDGKWRGTGSSIRDRDEAALTMAPMRCL